MIKRLLLSWLILGVLCAWTKLDKDPHNLQPVINAFQFDGVETTVGWEECGTLNAYYMYRARRVILCTELEAMPDGMIQYVLAHELAHGVIMQRSLPYTGSGEAAADELAAYVLHAMGYNAALLESAQWYLMNGQPEHPFDDHPSDMRRAAVLFDMAEGTSDNVKRIVWAWNYLLELPHE